ncbi:myelin expression factor 2-like [Liolophura sinensis]|uniref:myelin expression factor 2-like n=1 Tax=Liolophura sinensis TaxID=3198878 RepID=UPI003158AAB3
MADLSLQDSGAEFEESIKTERYSRSRSRSPLDRSRSRSPGRNNHRDRERRRSNITVNTKRVFVSNVPYEMKWQDLKDLFRKEVGEVAFVDMLETNDGKSKGAGIIEFKDKEGARRALEKMHRYKVKDRALVVREEREKDRMQLQQQKMGGGGGGPMGMNMGGGNIGGGNMGGGNMGGGMMGNMGGGMMGNNFGINPQILQQLGIEGPITNSVFVSNLEYNVTWKKLKDVFKLAGNVLHVEIKKNKEGKSKGIGVVEFEHPMEAVQAISMFNNQELFGRMMRVKMDADAPEVRPNPINLPSGLKGIGMGLGAGGAPLQNMHQMQGMAPGGMGMGMGGGMGSFSGGMGNMGNMGMGMGNMGGGMGNMGNMGGGMGNMGGTMDMGNMGGMGAGMSSGMNTGMGGNMNIPAMTGNLSAGMPSNMGNLGNQMSNLSSGLNTNMGMGMGDSMSGNYGGANMGMMGAASNMGSGGLSEYSTMSSTNVSNMMGSGQGMASSYNQSQPAQNYSGNSNSSRSNVSAIGTVSNRGRQEGCTVVAKNLPYSCTWQTLRERFRDVGDVKFAEIKTDKDGKSRGVGLVRFGSPEDAQRAVNLLNRTRIEGREIDVKLDRF